LCQGLGQGLGHGHGLGHCHILGQGHGGQCLGHGQGHGIRVKEEFKYEYASKTSWHYL
jgi:hypothetical protein